MRQAAGFLTVVFTVLLGSLQAGELPAAVSTPATVGDRYAPQAAMSAGPREVGSLGDRDHLLIEGSKTFTEKQLKDALFGEFDVYVAARAHESLDAYFAKVQEKLLRGYKHAGFPWIRVERKPVANEAKLAITIDEGQRFMAGDVLVNGAKTLSVAKLIERLTKPHPPKDSVIAGFAQQNGKQEPIWHSKDGKVVTLESEVWKLDKPASFHTNFETFVKEAFADLGYHFATFSVSVMPNTDTKKANLVIDITSEGSQCLTDDVQITGNKKNTREEILKYLDIKPGKLLDREELTRISSLLWRSGRFIKYEVKPVAPVKADDKGRLCIDLIELETASPLSKPLSAEEQILLKFRDWLTSPEQWDGDMCISLSEMQGNVKEFSVLVSPTQGTFLRTKCLIPTSPRPIEHSIVISPSEIGVYNSFNASKLILPVSDAQVILPLTLSLADDANETTTGRHKLAWGVGLSTKNDSLPAPFQFSLSAAPVYFVDIANHTKCSLRDGVLTAIEADGACLTLDASSGRFLSYRLPILDNNEDNPNAATTTPTKSTSPVVKGIFAIKFIKGEFQRQVTAQHTSAAKYRNTYNSQHPVSSVLQWACAEDLWAVYRQETPQQKQLRRLIGELNEYGALSPLDDVWLKFLDAFGSNDFTIPSDTQGLMAFLKTVATLVWQSSRSIFPPDSSPDLTMRVMLLSLSGQQQAATADWRQLLTSGQYGPFSRAMAEQLMKYNPMWQFAAQYQSPKPLTATETRNELAVLLNQDYPIGKFTRSLLTAVRELKNDDIQTLSELLPENKATAFRQWAKNWQSNRKLTVEDGAYELLTQVWQPVIAQTPPTRYGNSQAALTTTGRPQTTLSNSKPTLSNSRTPLPNHQQTANANLSPHLDTNSADSAKKYMLLGEAFLNQRQYDKAIADFDTAIQLSPNNNLGYWRRASAYAAKEEWDKALTDYTKALQLAPEIADVWLARAEVCLKMNQFDWTIADCTEAIRIDSGNSRAYRLRATAYQQKANADLAKAQQLEKKNAAPPPTTPAMSTNAFSMPTDLPFSNTTR